MWGVVDNHNYMLYSQLYLVVKRFAPEISEPLGMVF